MQQNKWFKRALWAMAGLTALWAITWLAVPQLLKSQIEEIASAQLGRTVTLGAVDFKPWSLELTLNDLAVARAPGAAEPSPQLFVQRIYIDAELQSLVRLAPVLDAFEMTAPRLSLTHLGDGHYDVDDILARLSHPAEKPDASPLRFALYNLALTDGALDFTDRQVRKTHVLRDLQIKLPFLSNFDSQRTVVVQPQLAFLLNGSRFDTRAQGTPFAQTHKTDATFKITDLDLAPYLAYAPASLPVKLVAAVLNVDLKVAFEQAPTTRVQISGLVQAGKVKLQSSAAKPTDLLAFDQLKLTLADVRPLERVARLTKVELSGANLNVERNSAGQLNLALLSKPQIATKNIAANTSNTSATDLNDAKNKAWTLAIDQVLMHKGAINWTDAGTAPAARLGLRDVTLEATGIALPFAQPLQFAGSAQLALPQVAPPVLAVPSAASALRFKGSATDQTASVTATLTEWPLAMAAPYVAQFMTPTLAGSLTAELGLNWQASADPAKPAAVLIEARQLTLDAVALAQGKTSLASLQKLQLEQARIDLNHQTVALDKLAILQPKVAVGRDADGQWMFESWRKPPLQTAAGGKSGEALASPSKPWALAIQNLALDGGAISLADKSTPKPVALDLAALSVQLKNFSTTDSKPFVLNVSTQMRAGRGDPGKLNWLGTLGLSPLAVQGQLEAVRLPVHALEPYLADALNIDIRKAEASFKGRVSFNQTAQGPVVKVNGDSALEEFRAKSLPLGEELLRMKLLSLRGLDLAIVPGSATTLAVKETVLSDFFARIILSEAGRMNLQDLVKASGKSMAADAQSPSTAPDSVKQDAINKIATNALNTSGKGLNDAKSVLPPVISFGPISLLGGRVYFSDRFIKPNYSADLTELTGKLGAFSSAGASGAAPLADLELRGRAEGSASLEITGKLNPLTTPVALDIRGRVRDLELPPLSPYSVRYSGYAIERGKLSVDVGYVVQPDGQLTASNNIVLNQLTFGEKVEGAPASLPVKLAVALLADRNGVIDINLPVSGSLNDPDFKLAPIVFKLLLNVVVKAITSPFSLLAGALGGGADELGIVSFAPGSAVLTADAKTALDKVVNTLLERSLLKLTVVGHASLEVERDAYQREQLKARVQAEKQRTAIMSGAVASRAIDLEGPGDISATDYPVLLKTVYRRADFPKPRNLVGLAKDIPVAEMEALLLANMPATESSMHELAMQRSVRVRDYLAAQKLPSERLFLGAAKVIPPEAKWSPRAELNLTTQ